MVVSPARFSVPVAFVLSGFAALIYQIVWQRVLLGWFGSQSESVAVVVAAFLLGLGSGSLVGGALSRWLPNALIPMFVAAEVTVGFYGGFSLDLFETVARACLGLGWGWSGWVSFGLVLVPTLMMGATLPLLVAYEVQHSGKTQGAVSGLYFANTLGAAVGAFAAAGWLLGALGLQGSVWVAVAANAGVVLTVLMGWVIEGGRRGAGEVSA